MDKIMKNKYDYWVCRERFSHDNFTVVESFSTKEKAVEYRKNNHRKGNRLYIFIWQNY